MFTHESRIHTSLVEPLVAGNFAAKILQRFAFNPIGISGTQVQQQMPAYVHTPPYSTRRGMPGHEVLITIVIFREDISTSTMQAWENYVGNTSWSMNRYVVGVWTYVTTASYQSKQCVNL